MLTHEFRSDSLTVHRQFDLGRRTERDLRGWIHEVVGAFGGFTPDESGSVASAAESIVSVLRRGQPDARLGVDVVVATDGIEVRMQSASTSSSAQLLVYRRRS